MHEHNDFDDALDDAREFGKGVSAHPCEGRAGAMPRADVQGPRPIFQRCLN